MRFSQLAAIFFLLKFTCPFEDEDFEEVEFGDRLDQLKEICAEEGFVRFNKFYLEDYLQWSSRNYSFLLLFVAMDQRCENCAQAIDEFAILAKSIRLAPISDLYLGIVDYDQTPEIFYRLRVRSIPSVALVAADHQLSSAKAAPQMNSHFSAEAINEWLPAKWQVPIIRPADYKRIYKLTASWVVGAVLVAWKLRQLCSLAGLAAMAFCSLMVSGHMFNRIHDTPWFHLSERGLGVISHESNFQFVCETYLIGAMYLGFGGCVIVVVDRGLRENSVSNATVAAALLLAALFYSFVVSAFRFKMDVYPFSGLVNMERYL